MLRAPLLALGLLAVCVGGPGAAASAQQPSSEPPAILVFPNANSRPTYFSIHNIREAWEISRGAGVKVGILDHSFGFRTHPGLYAGGQNFQTDDWGQAFDTVSHHAGNLLPTGLAPRSGDDEREPDLNVAGDRGVRRDAEEREAGPLSHGRQADPHGHVPADDLRGGPRGAGGGHSDRPAQRPAVTRRALR